MTRYEYRLVDGATTRDELSADDAHCRGATVHYREHGPHEEPGPWRVYGTGTFANLEATPCKPSPST